ncbi:stage III sporulation protein AE [Keratinibaculum paraultunense]|uniref:Stage III sporulation protein AE n=1 Tax=Keratinibaculum paraultunense TaxID=1278232 RepID=A0A4R3KYU0_9FIRM|nr:stage III sporulation protein AE [Keratinibaculum paraultunense]QQY80610.1 stage III sporulation protein AE [Keratinibaculum paraultunense]TCS91340.1 stage III sporulation protein AE [Keratinibaculum paraultunense]
MLKNIWIIIKILLVLSILFLFFYPCRLAWAEDNMEDVFIREQLDNLNIRELELVLEDIVKSTGSYYPKINIKNSVLSILKGDNPLNIKTLTISIGKIFFSEVIDNIILIFQIMIIVIACSMLTNLQSNFERDTVSYLAHYICYIILAMLIINSFTISLDLGKKVVEQMVNFMQIILPILLTLLTAASGASSKLLFHPMLIGSINVISSMVKELIFPLILFSFIIGIISNVSQKVQFTKLSELIRQIIIVLISIFLTIFIGIITVYGIGTKVDGITIRTAKYAVDNFIPIIGKFLSDAVETVIGCSVILKNGIGTVGLIALFLICIIPGIKIMVLMFVYKFIGAIIEPIANDNIVNLFMEVGKALLLVLIGILSVAIMFFITITIIVDAGNTALMFR